MTVSWAQWRHPRALLFCLTSGPQPSTTNCKPHEIMIESNVRSDLQTVKYGYLTRNHRVWHRKWFECKIHDVDKSGEKNICPLVTRSQTPLGVQWCNNWSGSLSGFSLVFQTFTQRTSHLHFRASNSSSWIYICLFFVFVFCRIKPAATGLYCAGFLYPCFSRPRPLLRLHHYYTWFWAPLTGLGHLIFNKLKFLSLTSDVMISLTCLILGKWYLTSLIN